MPVESKTQTTQRIYSARPTNYQDSWHPDYSRRFMEMVDVKPGDRILNPACGIGLEAVVAAKQVGDEGIVVGIDVTPNTLHIARKKQDADPIVARRLQLIQHNATDLTRCKGVHKASFDMIICSNAFVLFESPEETIAHWREYLKPGGRLIIDVTHENNMRSVVFMEQVARRMEIPFPSNRSWIKSIDSFRELLEKSGFVVERAESLEKVHGEGTKYLGIDQVDDQFDCILNGPLVASVVTDKLRTKGRPLFREEWEKAAVDGKVEFSDILYVYVARKN